MIDCNVSLIRKIVFCGKAVKLLQIAREKMQSVAVMIDDSSKSQKTWISTIGLSQEETDVFNYVSESTDLDLMSRQGNFLWPKLRDKNVDSKDVKDKKFPLPQNLL